MQLFTYVFVTLLGDSEEWTAGRDRDNVIYTYILDSDSSVDFRLEPWESLSAKLRTTIEFKLCFIKSLNVLIKLFKYSRSLFIL